MHNLRIGVAVSPTLEIHRDNGCPPRDLAPRAITAAPVVLEKRLTVIEARSGWRVIDVGEFWRYRELLAFLTWRDIKVRYKQTILGAAWAVLQPLATMVVFSLFFGRLAAAPSSGVPYPLFVFAGLLPWNLFANAIASAGQSVVGSQNLVTKVYFPRLIIPVAAVGAGLVDFAITVGVLVLLMLYFGVVPGLGFLLAFPVVLGLVAAALGVGVLLSALTVAYRDFRYVIPFLIQFWMFATPGIYMQLDAVSPRWRALLPLNPAQGLIINFRLAVLGGPLDYYSLAVSGTIGMAMLFVGCLYFRRVERTFADII
jgi:lipopolysaccharide transport system permease protein